jgi:DNA-binding transcriptional LysR family regulator
MDNQSKQNSRPKLAPDLDLLSLLVEMGEKCGSANSVNDLASLMNISAGWLPKLIDDLGHYCPEGEVFHHRPRQRPEFTTGGRELYRLAKEVLAAHRQIRRTHDTVTLTLCCSQLTATEFLPALLQRYAVAINAAGVPEPALVVRERDSPEAFLDLAQHGGFDVAIRGQAYSVAGEPTWPFPDNVGAFKISPLLPFGVIAPQGVVDRPRLDLLEVFGLGPPVGVQIPQALETTRDLQPFRRRIIKFDAHTTLVQMVRRGMCVAVAPLIGLGEGGELGTATITDGHLATAEFFVLWNRTHAELTQEEFQEGALGRHAAALWARSDYIRRFLAVCEEYARESGVAPL